MRHRNYKIIAISWVSSLLMVIFFTAVAASNDRPYPLQLTAGQNNPWAIPEPAQAPENYPGFQQQPVYKTQQYQGQPHQGSPENGKNKRRYSEHRMYQGNRFVTDEFLESLKRQQSQFQVMPDNRRNPQSAPLQQMPITPGTGNFGRPSYGTGYVEPLVDTLSDVPVVTPWTPWDIGVSDW